MTTTQKQNDTVATLYATLRGKAASFAFKPGERVNESALSRELGASRTPLREALNRLAAEGFVDLRAGQGFYCRMLSEERIVHLYQARMAIECETVRQATLRADDDAIAAILAGLESDATEYESCSDPVRLLELDETFHLDLAAMSENPELLNMLNTIYDKIRFVRAADLRRLQSRGRTTTRGHRAILDLVQKRDAQSASDLMRRHIEDRAQHAAEAVRLAFADLYAPQEP